MRGSQNPFFLHLDTKGQQHVGKAGGEEASAGGRWPDKGAHSGTRYGLSGRVVLELEPEASGAAGGPRAHAVQREAAGLLHPAGRPGPSSSSKPQGAGDRPRQAPCSPGLHRAPDLWGGPEATHAELCSPLTPSVLRPSQSTGPSGTRLWVPSRAGHAHLPLLAGVRGWTAPGRDHPSLPLPVTARGLARGPAGSGGTGVQLMLPLPQASGSGSAGSLSLGPPVPCSAVLLGQNSSY